MDQDTANAFKSLYDEIDRLTYHAVSDINFEKFTSAPDVNPRPGEILQICDIDELIEYSKKFVDKTKNELHTNSKCYEEQAVQCSRSDKKLNKKINTPPKWINSNQKHSTRTNQVTAIRIVKRIPKVKSASTVQDEAQLNNQKPVSQPKQVRNIGTNINFIKSKSIKQQNSTSPTTANLLPVIKKPVATQPSKRIYRFYSSKLSPSELWEQQHPELTFESSDKSLFPRRIKKSEIIATSSLLKSDRNENVKIVHPSEGLNTFEVTAESDPKQDLEQNIVEATVPLPEPPVPKITRHIIPTISIKGDWKANLRVQEIYRIDILDEKPNDSRLLCPDNARYLEIKYNQPASDKSTETSSKSVEHLGTVNNVDKLESEHPIIAPIKSNGAQDSNFQTNKNPNINKYLQPFMNCNKENTGSKNDPIIAVSDDDSSSEESILFQLDSSDSNTVDGATKLDLKFRKNASNQTINISDQIMNNISTIPMLLSPSKSVQLQVPSPPPVHSPSPSHSPASVASHRKVSPPMSPSDTTPPTKFLENLRVWKSAVQAQSENMKLGNQLSDNLDVLRRNMEIIAGETQNIANISRNCEKNLLQMEAIKEQYARNFDSTSPARTTEHGNPMTPLSRYSECFCFGCKPVIDTIDEGMTVELVKDHKNFQKTVLERSPKYSKMIKKIYEDGQNQAFKRVNPPPDEAVERAARKFLESCNRTISRISSRSHSSGSDSSWVASYRSSTSNDRGSTSSSWFEHDLNSAKDSTGESSNSERQLDRLSNGSSAGEISRVKISHSINSSVSDEGEVFSLGEIK
ncbi:uncharacterized protein LOC131428704 [Malaya genurostris]|uniref:uncharacterized protein LOC131428704 n=1 Tax=Malaya genurostris TaxID=325434 RepID=UPI0026F408B6|nr:uncharacterized protein LOC131428704 [Malaya genurostris]